MMMSNISSIHVLMLATHQSKKKHSNAIWWENKRTGTAKDRKHKLGMSPSDNIKTVTRFLIHNSVSKEVLDIIYTALVQ